MFKPSNYNFFIPDGDGGITLLFNGLRSSLIRLSRQLHPVVRDILLLEHVDSSNIPSEVEPLFNVLAEGGFIVPDTIDELDIIKERSRSSRESGPLHLIIAPTLDCNLACIYCYQSRSPDIMTTDICDHLVEFAQQKLRKGDITDIEVDWYGGEPLLAPRIISYLSKQLLNLSKRFQCTYASSIATNGTLLNNEIVNMLISNEVRSCQVTVDGPKEVHDKRRMYRQSNSSSFDRIFRNIRRVIGKMEVSVRINVDADNIPHAFSLLDIFREEGFFQDTNFGFFPYMAIAGPLNPCIPFHCQPVNVRKFYDYNLEFQEKVFQYSGRKRLGPILDFPFVVSLACAALKRNTYAFDPRGYYYKCALQIGEGGKECGYVDDETEWEQCEKWGKYNPLEDKECLGCRYLPFCMGTCPKMEFDKNSFYGKDGCVYWKRNLENIVKLYVRSMEEATGTRRDKTPVCNA